jgi:hypothetical protein
VQPDLLAEAHAVAQLAADPALAQACLQDIDEEQARQALTVLARAWELHDVAGPPIEAALRGNLPGLAVPAAAVAVQTSARIGGPLADALEEAPAPLDMLIEIEEAGLARGERRDGLTSSPRLRRGCEAGDGGVPARPIAVLARLQHGTRGWNRWILHAGRRPGDPGRVVSRLPRAWTPMRTACGVRNPGRPL